MSKKKAINVLMVTGVYFPEVNGATFQCMRIISALKVCCGFSVLTTTKHKYLVRQNVVDGIDVFRSHIGNRGAKLLQIVDIFSVFFTRRFDIVHLHGFSSRSALILLVSKLFNKKIIIKMTSFGYDDAISIKNKIPRFVDKKNYTDGFVRGMYSSIKREHLIQLTCNTPKSTRYVLLEKAG
jgi:hypothetical protein